MSHRPALDPDSPHYGNDDPTWNERWPPAKMFPRVQSGHCRFCGRSTARVVRSAEEVKAVTLLGMLCRACFERHEAARQAFEDEWEDTP